MKTLTVGLLGAGAQAAETADYVRSLGGRVVFKAVTAEYVDDESIELEVAVQAHEAVPVVVAVGAPAARAALAARWPGPFGTVVSGHAYMAADVVVGAGSTVAPMAVVNARARLGRHVLVNAGATVSHDVVLDDYATLAPGAHIGGGTIVGSGAFVGIGASVVDGVTLAPGTVVGAGAVVTADTSENGTYVGVPARCIGVGGGWLESI